MMMQITAICRASEQVYGLDGFELYPWQVCGGAERACVQPGQEDGRVMEARVMRGEREMEGGFLRWRSGGTTL
jgi:hypothetical protein